MPALTPEQHEENMHKLKEWTKLKFIEHKRLERYLITAMENQDKALDKLREESEEKYQKAIEVNEV